ncbi:MAG: sulfite exporter TauE/SafE family protein [Litorimonas sp.]
MDQILQNWPLIVALLAVGGVAGLTAGLFGIGGGAVMVPALFYAFSELGVPDEIVMHCSVATSAAVIILNALRSTRAHHAKDAVDMSLVWPKSRSWQSYGLWIGVGAFAAAIWIAPRLSGGVLTLIFAGIALLVSLQFIFGKPSFVFRETVPRGPAPVLAGGGVGVLSSLMGIGGGSLSVPLLTLCGVPIHRAIGTAAAFGLFIAVPATIGFVISGWGVAGRPFGSLGYVNGLGFALITIAAWPMVPFGAKLAHRLDATLLRRIFGICLALVAMNMARKVGLF